MHQIDRRSFLATSAGAALLTAAPAFAQTGEDARLKAMLDQMFEAQVDESPQRATSLGLDKGARAALKGQLDDNSAAGRARRLEAVRGRVAALKTIKREALSDAAKVDLDVVLYQNQTALNAGDKYKFGSAGGRFSPYVISQQTGVYQSVPDFLDNQHKIVTAADADAWLSRLHAFSGALDQDLDRMKSDVAAGVVPPDFVCDLSLGQLKALRDQPPEKTVMVTSLVAKAKAAGLAGDYATPAAKIVAEEIFPALDRQIAAVQAARAKATSQAGIGKLKNGAAYYQDAVRASTTTDLTPDQVHQMGLTQVAEISARLDTILKGQGLTTGTVAERLTSLNNRPDQLYDNTDEGRAALLAALNVQIGEIYKKLPLAFATLPKAKVEVKRVPAFIQDGAANGHYQGAALDGSRPANFFINLKETHDWPKYNLPTLVYHEAVPGHHLQIALAQESTKIPIIRRTGGGFSAFSEGWALYAEQLADEIGVYEGDPLGQAGYLQSLLFRASRLVIDTGIHAKGWSRDQATDYMVSVTGYPRSRAQREVERYCVSPGQACSYKVGHTVWNRVRDAAKAKLGARFDLKAWHDAALLSGSMPMTVLERHMSEWLATQA
ncbi:DUF885 domain-containing protein [Phenylobacterium aquaticum]|uniref:DUF885 domain-containing protein n=1 Tax=Phenylobacterium aquaticum TaxID=1763816 RepID=UPI001F5D97B7|nr:DUF885 family protein [Phenylobacterium aquaticum]MCI3132092.1 DUF885 family protein [Phenylobacterium aquaticum]